MPERYSHQADLRSGARSSSSYRRDAGYCPPDQAVARAALQPHSGWSGRHRVLAGLAEPAPVLSAGCCARCGGTTWQHQARDICSRCGHSAQHEALEVQV